MPRFPTPVDAMMQSFATSIRLAEAGTVFWLSLMNAGLWWLPRDARPAVLPVPEAPARAGHKRARG